MVPIYLARETALEYHRNQRIRLAKGRIAPMLDTAVLADQSGSGESEPHERIERRRALDRIARELGLSLPLHLCVPDRSIELRSARGRTHVDQTLPRHALFDEIASGLYVCRPSLALVQSSPDMSAIEIAQAACELCGDYALDSCSGSFVTTKGLRITLDELAADLALLVDLGTRGARKALDASRLALELSASPLETNIALLLTISRQLGGFGLPLPLLNSTVELSRQGTAIMGTSRIRPDLLWADRKVAAEIDSTAWHASAEAHNRDSDRRAALQASGYEVMTITSGQAYDFAKMSHIAYELSKRLGIRRERPSERMLSRRRVLHGQLFSHGSA